MYLSELMEREKFHYPPFYRLIELSVRHKEQEKAADAAFQLVKTLRAQFGKRVLGPETPGIARIRNHYHQNILIKVEKRSSIPKAKEIIQVLVQEFYSMKENQSVRIRLDVDPH